MLLNCGVGEDSWESLGLQGDPSWVFIGRTDLEAETPILWPPDAKCWLIGKDPDAGKNWGQEEKGTTEDEMVGWHHRLNGHGFGWTLGVGDGQGGLACFGSWGCKESDTTEHLNWTELNMNVYSSMPHHQMMDKFQLSCSAWVNNLLYINILGNYSAIKQNGNGFGWTLGVGDGQEGLACCGLWGCKESDTTERLNWTDLHWISY